MKLKDQKIVSPKLPAADITVAATQLSTSPLVFEVSAVTGSTSITERHTIGADGSGPDLTLADLQAAVDGFRQRAADKAAWQENMRLLSAQLK